MLLTEGQGFQRIVLNETVRSGLYQAYSAGLVYLDFLLLLVNAVRAQFEGQELGLHEGHVGIQGLGLLHKRQMKEGMLLAPALPVVPALPLPPPHWVVEVALPPPQTHTVVDTEVQRHRCLPNEAVVALLLQQKVMAADHNP